MNATILLAASTAYPLWAAVVAALVLICTTYAARVKEDQTRRRESYSEAFKAALEWRESVYRVRRRAVDGSEDRDLVMRSHDLQERLDYYQGVLSLEHEELGEAYAAFVRDVKTTCRPLLQEAWRTTGRPPTAELPTEAHPDHALTEPKQRFLKEARRHLNEPWNLG